MEFAFHHPGKLTGSNFRGAWLPGAQVTETGRQEIFLRTVFTYRKGNVMENKIWTCARLLAALLTLPPVIGRAQNDPGAHEEIAEIVVTAQKRSEDVNKVPISIAVFDQKSMDIQGVRDIADIANLTPGVQYISTGVVNQLTIRGISSTIGSPTTATYIDDVPVGGRTGQIGNVGSSAIKIFDLERVEVLRGPQGTLFGAGAEAGVIRFITPQPSLTESSGYARAELSGTQGGGVGYESGVAYGEPIVSNELGFRVSAWYRRDQGWIDDDSAIPGGVHESNANWTDTYVVRGALKFKPADNFTLTGSLAYQDVSQNSISEYEPSASNPPSRFVNLGTLRQPVDDRYILPTIKADWDLGSVSLTAISSYFDRSQDYTIDSTDVIPNIFHAPFATSISQAVPAYFSDTQKIYSEELRLQSADSDTKFKWTVGVFFLSEKQDQNVNFIDPGLPAFSESFFGLPIQEIFGSGLGPGNSALQETIAFKDDQLAGFGQVDYRLTTRLTLTAGVRVARQKDDFNFEGSGPLNGGAAVAAGSTSETPVTPKFGANLQVTDDSLLYASAAKGNRIGGANQPLLNTPACQSAVNDVGLHGTPESYKSDSLWSYEIGSKSQFFDHRLQIDADAYHIDWSNIQQNVHIIACASGFIANLGKATSDGAEFSATAQATDHLQLGASIGYNDAKLSANVGAGDAILGYKGDRVGTTPPWTINDWAKYTLSIHGYSTYIRADDEYNHKNPGPYPQQQSSTLGYDPYFVSLPSYNLLNVRSGVEFHGIDVSLFAMNVLNNHALLETYNLNVPGRQFGFTNRPLTVGLTAVARW